VILTNDAWKGTGHLWDVNVVRPIFLGDALVGYTMTITHLPDIGGRGYSAQNLSIYEEGLQIPPVKLINAGVPDPMVIGFIRQNVRVPEQVIGDVMANVSATEVGARLVLEFMADYGLCSLRGLADAVGQQSEAAMRAGIRSIADGVYENRIQVEAPDRPITLACRIVIAGDRLGVDFAGTSGQLASGINVPLCYSRAMAGYALKCLLAPDIPNNDGSVRPMELTAPEGCILNATPPAATAARSSVGHFVVPLVFGALAPVLPERAQADPGMITSLAVSGRRPDGARFSTLLFSAGGFGAMQGLDGSAATPAPANITTMPAETWETLTGMTVVTRRLRPDSGGAGAYRGGLGQELVLRNDVDEPVLVSLIGSRTDFPARGIYGGRDGATRIFTLNGVPIGPKESRSLGRGDVLVVADAGGGGYGDPRARDRAAVAADIAAGFVTLASAQAQYDYEPAG
jgi:N-methylhydantoinase B